MAISPHERLTAMLRFLATGRSYKDLEFSTIISKQALSRIIPETCEASYNVLKKEYLKLSTENSISRFLEKDNEQESLNDEEIQTETSFSALLSTYDMPSSSSQPSTSRKRMRSGNSNDLTTKVLQLAGEKLQAIHSDDEFDVYGKYIAHKLCSFRGKQYIFA
ncbi:hypothetical protein ABEB36_004808 [Hypothenemus hampei]|uniref:Uncharacterized protein n=1 Tax=Hypothenemus hampei TaxID=57062 RepID=A0ABD1EVY1_HYPHA